MKTRLLPVKNCFQRYTVYRYNFVDPTSEPPCVSVHREYKGSGTDINIESSQDIECSLSHAHFLYANILRSFNVNFCGFFSYIVSLGTFSKIFQFSQISLHHLERFIDKIIWTLLLILWGAWKSFDQQCWWEACFTNQNQFDHCWIQKRPLIKYT